MTIARLERTFVIVAGVVNEQRLADAERCARTLGHVDGFTVIDIAAELRSAWAKIAEFEGAFIDPDANPFP